MSKFKLTYTLSKYAGTKIKDIVKTLKSNNKAKKQPSKKALATKKSKANAERVGLGTKSIKRYNIRAGARNDKMVPIKKQSQTGSSFQTHNVRGKMAGSRSGTDSAESWRHEMERMYSPISIESLIRGGKRKKTLGGSMRLRARNTKNFKSNKS